MIKNPFLSRKRAFTTFLSQKLMITRSSITFEDFLGSSIAPQVMPLCQTPTSRIAPLVSVEEDMDCVCETGDLLYLDPNKSLPRFMTMGKGSTVGRRASSLSYAIMAKGAGE